MAQKKNFKKKYWLKEINCISNKMTGSCCVSDIRVSADKTTTDGLRQKFKEIAKKWSFQLEKGETTGYLHYQCRISLKQKKRDNELRKILDLECYISPTSCENRDNNFYVTKEDTRVDGPWMDSDSYIPRQVREIEKLHVWQQQILESRLVWDTRSINILYDPIGGMGKTTIKTYIGAHKFGRALPFMNDYRDMLRIVMDTPKVPLYIIDIPRAISKDKLFQFFSAIETIKDGYAYDDRYSFKEQYFDCPTVWVFMNVIPDRDYLSKDRWVFWRFSKKGNLKKFTPETTSKSPENSLENRGF